MRDLSEMRRDAEASLRIADTKTLALTYLTHHDRD